MRLDLRLLSRTVGAPILLALAASALFGVLLGAIELVFAYALNLFLATHGLIKATQVPPWLAPFSQSPVLLILVVIAVRFACMLAASVLSNLCNELANRRGRGLILQATLDSSIEAAGLSSSETANITGNVLPRVALFLSSASQLFNQLVVGALLLASMLVLSPKMTLLGMAGLAVVGIPTMLLRKSYQFYSSGYQRISSAFIERLIRGVRNIFYLRLTGNHLAESAALAQSARTMSGYAMQYVVRSQLAGSLPSLGGTLIFVALVAWSAGGNIHDAGGFLGFLYLFYRFSAALGNVILTFGQTEFALPFVKQFLGYADRLLRVPVQPAGHATITPPACALSAEALLVGRESPLLGAISLRVSSGEAVVIAGPSGRGKTTLLMTLIGLVPRLGGSVSWGGIPIDDLDHERFRRLIGYSGADPYLVDGSLLDNLRLGAGDVQPTDGEIRDALDLAQCGFVDSLEGGLAFRLQEGGQGLSAGEKQRLSIARALLRKPAVIVFDEATANIDEAAEALIVKGVRARFPAAVMLMVSHRQSLRAFADRVIEI